LVGSRQQKGATQDFVHYGGAAMAAKQHKSFGASSAFRLFTRSNTIEASARQANCAIVLNSSKFSEAAG